MSAFTSPLGADYDTTWSRSPLMSKVRTFLQLVILRPGIRLLTRPHVVNRNKRIDTPIVVVANHSSHLDTSVLLTTLPRKIRKKIVVAAAADYFFNKRPRAIWWSLTLNAVPVERLKVNRRSAQQLQELIGEDYSVLIFPEGTRSDTGEMAEFKPGAAFLATKANVPVLPVYLHGVREVMGKGKRLAKPGQVEVRMGDVLYAGGKSSREFAQDIEAAVRKLAD